MVSSGMLRRVALVRTDVSEEPSVLHSHRRENPKSYKIIIVEKLTAFKLEGNYVSFEVFTAVTMKNGVFLDVTPCGSCKNRRFGGT
jgi:hypothetical protein